MNECTGLKHKDVSMVSLLCQFVRPNFAALQVSLYPLYKNIYRIKYFPLFCRIAEAQSDWIESLCK